LSTLLLIAVRLSNYLARLRICVRRRTLPFGPAVDSRWPRRLDELWTPPLLGGHGSNFPIFPVVRTARDHLDAAVVGN
jgi:hypothetical protein